MRVERPGCLDSCTKAGGGRIACSSEKGEPVQLNFQDRDGYIPSYQAHQLVRMIEKYGSGS